MKVRPVKEKLNEVSQATAVRSAGDKGYSKGYAAGMKEAKVRLDKGRQKLELSIELEESAIDISVSAGILLDDVESMLKKVKWMVSGSVVMLVLAIVLAWV